MPLYQCISPQGLIDDSQRKNIAAEITRIHSGATGAPPSIVTVAFSDADKGTLFNDGQASTRSVVVGVIRAGRAAPTRKKIVAELSQAWVGITGQAEADVLVILVEESNSSDSIRMGLD
jgi:phenylpyruvate tautomerase PptA (4-oxalocrotonate tautomerase family)